MSTLQSGADSPVAKRVGFGCAGLMQSASAQRRQQLLAEAFEQGIRHFDVARMYGLGAAERELGRFARGRREELVIASKFGIEPGGSVGGLARLQAPARAVVARFPALRRALKRRSDAFHQPRRYDVASARASLHTSLRELATDYLDVLFIHDPAPDSHLDLEELGGALEELRRAGTLRAWGFAGEPQPCIELSRAATASAAASAPVLLQIRDDILTDTLAQVAVDQPLITFGILAPALRRIVSHVAASSERRSRWNGSVGEDCARPEAVSALLLQDALERNPQGTVLFSTTRPERVRVATEAAQTLAREPARAALRAFQELVLSELGVGAPARG